MTEKPRPENPQPLSAKGYVYVALIMFLVGIVLLVLFALLAPSLARGGVLEKFYYIVLLAWGMISALVMFGVVHSYAKVTYTRLAGGIKIEISGAAAFAALVVLGGYVLVPNGPFNLTIRPHSPGSPLITSGKIRVEFGALASTIDVNQNGEADFKGIPHNFLGTKVKVLPLIEGYKREYQEKIITGDAIDLDLEVPETALRGQVFPMPSGRHVITVLVEGELARPAAVDQYGEFKTVVHKNLDDVVRLTVCEDGWRVYDDLQPVRSPQLRLRKRDQRCIN
jgi:hypothetical protein